ncbi:MAG: polyphenol oxidase family protein [Actinomycetota bacterium]|nr:polyphenol oxidase family protein [Actinomycetota bacterium]
MHLAPEPEPDGVRIAFFTRLGGVSEKPFDSLNVSTKVGDTEEAVSENLSRTRSTLEDAPSAWVKQVAGDTVERVVEAGFAGEADALVTRRKGVPLVVGVADCVPVAIVGGEEIGMVHSGWRGTLEGISGKAVAEITGAEVAASEVRAYIGPCIRECCYEVSEELVAAFVEQFGEGVASGRYLSLPEAIRRDLASVGVEDIADLGLCTGCRPDLFYSHRKEKPVTGRNLAAIMKLAR